MLAGRGRPVRGKKPTINLSSLLSRDPGFKFYRGRGWYPTAERGGGAINVSYAPKSDAPLAQTSRASS